MRVIRNSRAWRWNDVAKFFGDIETNGGPVSVTGLDSFLVLAHGIDLNVCTAVAYLVRALPGYNIFDGVALKSTKCNNVATKKRSVFPADRVNINTVVNSGEHAFGDNSVDEMVFETSCSSTLLPPLIPHGFHMEWSSVHMDSTWNGVQSTWIPHGMEFSPHRFHMEWSSFHMDSM